MEREGARPLPTILFVPTILSVPASFPLFVLLEIEPGASRVLGEHPATKLHSQAALEHRKTTHLAEALPECSLPLPSLLTLPVDHASISYEETLSL